MAGQAYPAVSVRAVSGGREWHVPDGDGDLTVLAAKRYLVTHGGFLSCDQLFLLAGTRALNDNENVQTVLAETNQKELTVVVCEPPWLADDRVILAGKWLRAVFAGSLSPGHPRYIGAPVGPDDLRNLLQSAYALGERSGIAVQEVSAKDFLLVLGAQMHVLQRALVVLLPQIYEVEECPLPLARCAVLWALACAAPFVGRVSFPLILPRRSHDGSVIWLTVLRPRDCDLRKCLGPSLYHARCCLHGEVSMDLEGVSRAHLIEPTSSSAPDITLEAHTTVAVLQVRARLEAGLPVVLLGSFPAREDVALCDLAGSLLFRHVQGRVLDDHEVSGLPADFRPPADDDGPVTLLRARGEAHDLARLAHLATAAGCWTPRMVWSVSTRGTTRQQVLSLLPRELGEAAVIPL